MIARHEAHIEKTDIWSKLAAPLPAGSIAWRQDGKPSMRDGKYFARFVAYIDANTVRERLDGVVPGEWDLTLDLLPPLAGEDGEANASFKARLQILGVIREDVGTGRDYKQAATDAFKRAAVRFGIAHELYAYEQNWVQVDGDGRYAKPLEDPATAYARRLGKSSANGTNGRARAAAKATPAEPQPVATEAEQQPSAPVMETDVTPECPKCGGKMWDNRATKRNPKAPDYKCRDRTCDGVVWPPKPAANGRTPAPSTEPRETSVELDVALDTAPLGGGMDDIPF